LAVSLSYTTHRVALRGVCGLMVQERLGLLLAAQWLTTRHASTAALATAHLEATLRLDPLRRASLLALARLHRCVFTPT
jgi:hypothetical protein